MTATLSSLSCSVFGEDGSARRLLGHSPAGRKLLIWPRVPPVLPRVPLLAMGASDVITVRSLASAEDLARCPLRPLLCHDQAIRRTISWRAGIRSLTAPHRCSYSKISTTNSSHNSAELVNVRTTIASSAHNVYAVRSRRLRRRTGRPQSNDDSGIYLTLRGRATGMRPSAAAA